MPFAFATMDRSISDMTVEPGTSIDITYTSSSSGFNGIEDTLTGDWTLVTVDDLVSLGSDNIIRAAWTGTTKTITLTAPASDGTYNFIGVYEATGGASGDITGDGSVEVGAGGTCTPDCSGRECGTDGCGGTCGSCGTGETCTGGQCVGGGTTPTPRTGFNFDSILPWIIGIFAFAIIIQAMKG